MLPEEYMQFFSARSILADYTLVSCLDLDGNVSHQLILSLTSPGEYCSVLCKPHNVNLRLLVFLITEIFIYYVHSLASEWVSVFGCLANWSVFYRFCRVYFHVRVIFPVVLQTGGFSTTLHWSVWTSTYW